MGADRFRGLKPQLYLARSALVCINSNIRSADGLVNGALGEIVHMKWGKGKVPPSLPEVIFVRFLRYRGPETHASHRGCPVDLRNTAPIVPMEASDDRPSTARRNRRGGRGRGTAPEAGCVRTQFPLRLSYGMTHHKSQGCTFDKVVVDMGSMEITNEQTHLAMSRCRGLGDLLVEKFSPERILNRGKSMAAPVWRAEAGDSTADTTAATDKPALDDDVMGRLRKLEDATRARSGLPPLDRSGR